LHQGVAIHVGHADIAQQQGGLVGFNQLYAFPGGDRRCHRSPLGLEQKPQKIAGVGVVIDHQNSHTRQGVGFIPGGGVVA